MKRSQFALLLAVGAGAPSAITSGCSSTDSTTPESGGSPGQAGGSAGKGGSTQSSGGAATAGHGGSAGSGGLSSASGASGTGGGVSQGGASGGSGEGGASGGVGEAGSGGEGVAAPCGPSLTRPDVPATIQVTDSAVLVAAYAAEGTQTYTCQATGTGDTATYAWSTASVPSATLYDSACMVAATHYAGPHWKSTDGSIVLGTKVRSAASSTAASIAQLLLSATVDGGNTGILTPATAAQRLDTVGGIAPSTGCDAAHVNATVAVPYTANYYFYSGASIIPPA